MTATDSFGAPVRPGRLPWLRAGMACAVLALPASAARAQGDAAGSEFASPSECVVALGGDRSWCADIARRAWETYITHAPRFLTLEGCWKHHEVCSSLPPDLTGLDPSGRFVRTVSYFAPPLAAVRMSQGIGGADRGRLGQDRFVVLVDRKRQPLSALNTALILQAGRFQPTADMLRASYVAAMTRRQETPPEDPPRLGGRPATLRDALPGGEPILGRDFYPVIEHRLRDMRRRSRN